MQETFTYRIDARDQITYVSDNWCDFANENNGANCCTSPLVLGKSLWDFISDMETRHIYELVLAQVRSSNEPSILPINCDSPELKRFIEITMTPLVGGGIEFSSKIVEVEERVQLKILDDSVARSRDIVKICSFCKKIATSDTAWEETGVAVKKLKLFDKSPMPMLSHGVCPDCFEHAMGKVMAA